MKKFVVSIAFIILLGLELGLIVYFAEIEIDQVAHSYSLELPYVFFIAVLIVLTIILNGYVFKKMGVKDYKDAPLILKSDDEREQALINKYAVIGFAYITPIILLVGLFILAFSMIVVSEVETMFKLFAYAIVVFITLPFVVHNAIVLYGIKKV